MIKIYENVISNPDSYVDEILKSGFIQYLLYILYFPDVEFK